MAGCFTGFLGSTALMAIDSAGKLMIVYHVNDTPGVAEQMYIRTSNGGTSRSSPDVRLLTDGTTGAAARPRVMPEWRRRGRRLGV